MIAPARCGALTALAGWLLVAAAAAEAAGDWPIVAPATTLHRVGNRAIPGSLRASLAALPVICDDGWSDDGEINSPVVRFFTAGGGRAFVAVQCPGAEAEETAVFENTTEAIRTMTFAAFADGKLIGTTLLDILRIEPMTGVIISESEAASCRGEAQRLTYQLGREGFILLKAETRPCATAAWSVIYSGH